MFLAKSNTHTSKRILVRIHQVAAAFVAVTTFTATLTLSRQSAIYLPYVSSRFHHFIVAIVETDFCSRVNASASNNETSIATVIVATNTSTANVDAADPPQAFKTK